MAIAHNTTTSGGINFATELTFAHTTTGADKLLIVAVAIDSDVITIDSVTHNGDSLSSLSNQTISGLRVALFYIVNPDASGNVVVTTSASTNIAGIANSYTGVAQTSTFGTVQFDMNVSGASAGCTITLSSTTGELCFDACFFRSSTYPTITGGQTARGTETGGAGARPSGGCSEEAGAASVTMSWSYSAWTAVAGQIGVPIKPVSGAPPSTILPNKFNLFLQQHSIGDYL